MSRRTKLCITALFLVLLAIPAAYVAVTWRTPNPLRFHIVAYHEPSSPEAWPEYGKLDLVVDNTSNLPVHFFIPAFGRSDFSPGATELRGITSPATMRTFLVIPPRSTTAFSCRVIFHGNDPPSTWDNTEVRYSWYTDTRYRYSELHYWLRAHAPERFESLLEYHYPQFDEDTTMLAPRRP